ncbi:hypothetical protein Y013_24905 (plasmid) [Rhodococcus pyridinivorans SB3094]|uniref:Uncharacterized protein n=1 Tax=Rhodococcus pyridinivorans SB3094 TaxID=1435356 RepID=V9XPT3_9NOCA|nr:hypothetical protein [Rhodococcus pyridinivorans]AHD24020.1 hypothetical protein Y013_24905 [Rhodococcus pyridinivorans SB3094]
MNSPVAVDRDGRQWAVLAIDSRLTARLVRGTASPAVLDLDELVHRYGPLILSPTPCSTAGGFIALADTVGLVASDPETASVEQIRQVAAFAQSIVAPHGS